MSFLIIGGAFVVALLAVIGLFFVIRQEQQTVTPEAQAIALGQQEAAAATTGVPIAPTTTTAQGPSPVSQEPSVNTVPTMPVHQKEDYFPVSNGQLHEFSVELRTLHEQAQELEHRLNILTEMMGRIERTQRSNIGRDDTFTGDVSSTLN